MEILGELSSKSNSRRLVTYGGKPRMIKSQKALDYEKTAIPQIKSQWRKKPLACGVGLDVDVYYASRRPDLDISLLMDVLEKAGVYENDRLVVEYSVRKHLDKDNPRTIVEIYELDKL